MRLIRWLVAHLTRRRVPRASREARDAQARAVADLRQTQERWTQIRKTTDYLRQETGRNHFSEEMTRLFGGTSR